MCAENKIRVLCNYLLLDYMDLTKIPISAPRERERGIWSSAVKLYTRRTLTTKLLHYKPIHCIEVCCLLSTIEVLNITGDNTKALERSVKKL